MPSLTTNCNINTSSQQEKLLFKKSSVPLKTSSYTTPTTSLSPYEKVNTHSRQNSRNYHHHHNHVRHLSSLDCYTLKNEIVKLNAKSSYCFDNNTYDYSKSTDWKENCNYQIGDLVCYNRQYYKVIQNVLSEEKQTPDIANEYYILIISLVSRIASKRVLISKWTPYCRFITKGEQVFYDGKVWTALVSQNYEENKKKDPLFMADSPDQPSQKGLWEIEHYNIDELEIVEDMIEFSDDDSSVISSEETEVEEGDADVETNSTITQEGEDSYLTELSKDLNDMDTKSSLSTLSIPNFSENSYIKEICRHESEHSTNSDNTMNEDEEFSFVKINGSSSKSKIQNIINDSDIQTR